MGKSITSVKKCLWHKKHVAAVPIKRGPGIFIKQICTHCHGERLRSDMQNVLASKKRQGDPND